MFCRTIDITNGENEENDSSIWWLRIRRITAFDDAIEQFKNPEIDSKFVKIKMIDFRGREEKGHDDGGVFRDFLSLFSEQFRRLTVGCRECCVPFIRHNVGPEKWIIIARIFRKGFVQSGFFPVFLAQPFMEACILGKENFDPNYLMDQLLFTLGSARKTVEEAMKASSEEEWTEIQKELYDILGSEGCRVRYPENSQQLITVLKEIAHTKIIQAPKFIIDLWETIWVGTALTTEKDISSIYKSSYPTGKNIVKLLPKVEDVGIQERDILSWLRKWVRSADYELLSKFLRFTTGANMICVEKIDIMFREMSYLETRFIGHTCGCVLEVPLNYAEEQDLMEDLEEQLKSNHWEMEYK